MTLTPSPPRLRLTLRQRPAARAILLAGLAALLGGAACNTNPAGQTGSGDGFTPLAQPAGPFGLPAGAAPEVARDIEEADIVKVVDGRLYALNRYKGLLIIDVANPDAPALLGSLDLRGRGVEMYVLGARVHVVLTSDFVYFAGAEGGSAPPGAAVASPSIAPPPEYNGSQLAIVDVSNPAAPALRGKLNLAGYTNDSRRVGDIIYVVGGSDLPYYLYGPGPQPDAGFVASVSVADPDNVQPVARRTFSGQALTVHVSQTALFAASQEYDSDSGGSRTRVQAIDISDPAGAIALRGAFTVPGFIRNRFYMDDFQGAFRIATETDGFGFRDVRLFTHDLANLDAISPLGQTHIIQGESLRAVRFDGPRGYVVTFLQVDPLFVLDLADPAHPAVAGHLEVPGFSTHIEPRGERLIAVGIDDTDGRRPAVAYYDVHDPAHPAQLGRVVLGAPGGFTDSQAVWDEKAFKIVDELGLVAIPFRQVSGHEPMPMPFAGPSAQPARPDCVNAVQLVDFSDSALTQRGFFEHAGRVDRVGAIGGRIFALSDMGFQTVNIADRDRPVKAGGVEFIAANERSFFDDCYGYVGPIDPGFGQGAFMMEALLRLLLGGMCGATGLAPLLCLPALLCVMRHGGARRRRG
jgi:hypothetical protein